MKTIPVALQDHYDGNAHTLAIGLRFLLADGTTVHAFTSHQEDITVGGQLYLASPGANLSAIASAANFSVDNAQADTVLDSFGITVADLAAGRWDAASWELVRFNYRAPADGVEVLKAGRTGNVSQRRGQFSIELRSLAQQLQQPVGAATSQNCRSRLGDARCGVALAPFTVTGAFTSVASRYAATDSARTEADGWFTEGELTITSGDNAGLRQKVKSYAADQFTFSLPFAFDIDPGDTYSVHAGCRRRLVEDCVSKFSNARRFNGEPHLPGVDRLARPPEFST